MDIKRIGDEYIPPEWSKQQMHEYRKKRKKFKKNLIKAAKKYQPWDYGFIIDCLDVMLADMEEYFSTGVNVMQVDESRLQVVDQLREVHQKLADYYEADETLEDDPEEKLKEFCNLLGKYLPYWWD